ncbi:MAG: hypothetical protein N3A69_17500 [Leptospiraceae bacterium]|nr:hypothetical protein [Leptospiraceae bacterium]
MVDWFKLEIFSYILSILIIPSFIQLTRATTDAFLPIVVSFAKTQNLSPLYLIIPTHLCQSYLPVIPPNTILYTNNGKVSMEAMIRSG